MTTNNSGTSDSISGNEPHVEVVKGQITDAQRTALEQIVGDVAEAVERERNLKPDTRGHFGTPTRQAAANIANPSGFRSVPLPRR